MKRLFKTPAGLIIEVDGRCHQAPAGLTFDTLFAAENPAALLVPGAPLPALDPATLLAPLDHQEVWAAGVTYLRSRTARMEESKVAGGGSFYDRVYEADRPELFFKATASRVVAPGGAVRIRADSKWNVPEPELTLALNTRGRIFGYTVGNDMSSRDIEGENPLYLPQAKVYAGCAAFGPGLLITDQLPSPNDTIRIAIRRAGAVAFSGEVALDQIKRPLPSLAAWLWRDNVFPHGAYLMTGTGIVPPDSFTLQSGDEISISLDPVGTLVNTVA